MPSCRSAKDGLLEAVQPLEHVAFRAGRGRLVAATRLERRISYSRSRHRYHRGVGVGIGETHPGTA